MAVAPDKPTKRHWTVEDYMQLDDDRRYELLQGDLLMTPSPNIFHQRAITKLGTRIDVHVTENDLGDCFDAPFDVVLSDDTVVQPDFTFVRRDRLAELYDGHCISGAPDLVVEVLSASTEARDRHRKRQLYAEAGVPWLLFVEPESRIVEVFHLREDGSYAVESSAAGDDTLTFELFPELEIALGDVWFEPPEETTTDEDA